MRPNPPDERADIVRKAKEFFYVDLQRVRSYYAQLNRGVVESVIFRDASLKKGDLEAALLGFGPRVGAQGQHSREESRSLQDLTLVIFEELLEREKLITEATFDNPQEWRNGGVQDALFEGQILRMTTEIQILDPMFFRQRVAQVERLGRAIVGIQSPGNSPRGGKGGARAAERAALRQFFGDMSPEALEKVSDFVAAFTNDTIMVRVLPCGKDNLDCHFAGVLLGRSEYIQEEREALFSRHGTTLNDWTILMQIARIPVRDRPVQSEAPTDVFASPSLDRASIEQMAITLVDMMEQEGIAEGIKWPAVSVTPLAIYREFA